MAKKKASLRGRGHSILLGDEAPESLPLPLSERERPPEAGGDVSSAEHEPAEEEKVDWSAMLEDEASTAVPPEEEVAAPSLPTIEHYFPKESPAEPEPPPPAIEGPAVAEPSPPPISSVAPPTPVSAELPPEAVAPPPPISEIEMPLEAGEGGPSEVYAPEDYEKVDWSPMVADEVTTAEAPAEEVALPVIEHYYPPEEPPLPESELPAVEEPAISPSPPTPAPEPEVPSPPPAAAQPSPAVPPSPPHVRIGGLLAGMSLAEEVAPPGPGFEEVKVRETTKAPPKELTEEEEEIVVRRVSRKQRRELFELISKLYGEVTKKLASSGLRARREEALLLLSEARDVVLEDPRQFDEAEHKVWQVEAIIAQAEDVEKWSHYYGNRLMVYLTTWFVLLIAGIVFFNPLSVWLDGVTAGAEGKTPLITVSPLLFTMLWGGIGGVVGGLYSLWRHIAEFDKQYTIWYTLQPITGIVLGGIIHVIVMTGFLSMSIQTSGSNATVAQQSQAVQWFPALLAVVAGFRQNFAYALIDRIIELVGQAPRGGDNEEQAEAS